MFLPEEVRKYLKDGGFEIITKDITGSTNLDMKEYAENGAGQWLTVIAGEQTSGRGRRGRSFYSPKDTGLYMSILLRPQMPPEQSLFITVTAACAAALAIDSVCGVDTGIKWVNDIYLNERKICGILTESALSSRGIEYSVLGIGVNVSTESFPEDIKNKAGSINASSDIRARLAAGILERFREYYTAYPDSGFMSVYRKKSILSGRKVSFIKDGAELCGTVLGIDEDASLRLITDSGEELSLRAGEVSVIPK